MKSMPEDAESLGPQPIEAGCRTEEEFPDEIDKISGLHGEDGARSGHRHDGGGAVEGADDLTKTVDIARVFERFETTTRTRLGKSTIKEYRQTFERFARETRLEKYTRRQLMGPRGKNMLLSFLETIPVRSRRFFLASLKAVWTSGLGLAWPVDPKQDMGRLPGTRREQSPPDNVVKEWAIAMANERDCYLRLLWLLIAQHGWRSSHVARIKWRNVRYDEHGKPVAIVADGAEEGFKTNAPVAARLSPDVAEALEAWKREVPSTQPDKPILPWRSWKGDTQPGNELNKNLLWNHWKRLQEKWKLPSLRPKDMRHWVATTCRKAGLSKQASAYLMGHDPAAGGVMRDWYDSPQLDDVFDEQASRLPGGPLGILEPPEVHLVEGLPQDAVSLLKAYLAGNLGTLEFANRMETVRLQSQVNTKIEP